ncbi:MAG TPA: HTTM domain-containing protein [Candidatus Baltobacteraceae bacterium]|nr:HTTM domain-containing protein [Candidatus Baltobacteraceae bacterium]
MLKKIDIWLMHPHRLVAASVLRVGLAFCGFLFYAMHFTERTFFWGPYGQLAWTKYVVANGHNDPFALYTFSSSPMWAEALYWLGILASLALLLGIYPRLTAILFYLLIFSTYNRDPELLDGGNNILYLLALYLCFADCGRYFCLLRLRSSGKLRRWYVKWLARPLNALHNAAMIAVVGQVALLYFWSAFYKVTGHKWQDGTAIYYVLRVDEFQFPPFSSMIYENALLVTALTYATLLFQWTFPVLMWNRRAKAPLFLAAALFHTGIAIFMGLVVFSLTMVVADLAIFSDDAFLHLGAIVRSAYTHVSRFASRTAKLSLPGRLS